MTNQIVAFASQQAKLAARKVAFPVALALIGGTLILLAVAGLFAALFFWLEPERGPLAASLITTAVALALGLIVLLPLALRRGPPPPATTGTDLTLPTFVGLLARSAPTLAPRQLAMTGVLLALALGLMARGSSETKK